MSPHDTGSVVFELRNVSKIRTQGGVTFELAVPSLTVRARSLVGLVGPSGCGKSTLLDLLALVLRPTNCETFFIRPSGASRLINLRDLWIGSNTDTLAHLRKHHLGYVLQTGGLFPFLTVAENILLPVEIRGQEGPREKMLRMAERIGIASILDKKPQYLSGGQRQRVAVLRALIHDPLIVLADEPTAAVDRERAESIIQTFQTLAEEEGSSIIMATHDERLIASVADTLYTFRVTQESKELTRSLCVPDET